MKRERVWGFAVITLAAICIAQACTLAYLLRAPGLRYRRTLTGDAFTQAYISLQAGDSIDEVSRVLGPGVRYRKPVKRLHEFVTVICEKNPGRRPDGVQDTDIFILYPTKKNLAYLQFRDDRLINYCP